MLSKLHACTQLLLRTPLPTVTVLEQPWRCLCYLRLVGTSTQLQPPRAPSPTRYEPQVDAYSRWMEAAEISGTWRPTDIEGPRLDRSSRGPMVSIDAGSSHGIGRPVSAYSDTDDMHDDDDVSPVQRITDTYRRKSSCWHELSMRGYTSARQEKRWKQLRLVDGMSSTSMGI